MHSYGHFDHVNVKLNIRKITYVCGFAEMRFQFTDVISDWRSSAKDKNKVIYPSYILLCV